MKSLKLFLAVIAFAAFPLGIEAATYNYSCTDMTSGDSPSCTDGAWTKASAFSLIDATGDRPFTAGTWYFNGVVTGSGGPFRLTCYEHSSSPCTGYVTLAAGTYVDEPFTIAGGTSQGLYLWGQSSTDPGVAAVCVSDVLGDCAGGGGGGGSTTTVQYVDSPVQDLFYGYILFLSGLTLIIWIMRGRKTH